jgi:ribosome biogenesis protein Nip4
MHTALKNFLELFGDIPFPLEKVIVQGKEVYLVNTSAQPALAVYEEEPVSQGLLVGTITKNSFLASIALLRHIAPHTEKKIILNEKSAWLFVCGRDAFDQNIVSGDKKSSLVIVLDEQENVLGLAKKTPQFYKNMLHIGTFLKENKQI